MKSKLAVAIIALTFPMLANADRYGHHHGHGGGGHHYGRGGNAWIAPAIIGGAIVGSAIYGATRDDEPVVVERVYPRRAMSAYEIREEQLRQREAELEQREHEYYEQRQRHAHNYEDNCREYYRNERGGSYYSKNCW